MLPVDNLLFDPCNFFYLQLPLLWDRGIWQHNESFANVKACIVGNIAFIDSVQIDEVPIYQQTCVLVVLYRYASYHALMGPY